VLLCCVLCIKVVSIVVSLGLLRLVYVLVCRYWVVSRFCLV